jgi:farnesyl-diphosphate farnesyltransferase
MTLDPEVLAMLEATSRTFYVPIARLPDPLRKAVAVSYLCMRAIDEIEDHPLLDKTSKAALLRTISLILRKTTTAPGSASQLFSAAFDPYRDVLPPVSSRIGEWACLAPEQIAPQIWAATATMADRMAQWVDAGWRIRTEDDLDRYTFAVAGSRSGCCCATSGRGLQAVNILRNRPEDEARGVHLFPDGWTTQHMDAYARRNLDAAETYARTLPPGPFRYFIQIPAALAFATLDALLSGKPKLDRSSASRLMGSPEGEEPTTPRAG